LQRSAHPSRACGCAGRCGHGRGGRK
jgi:hypothetical protein